MTPNRKLIYGFMGLPYYTQIKLLEGLYAQEEYEQLDDVELFTASFRRARERGLIGELKTKIQRAVDIAEVREAQ